jgi:hypothetical protein
MSCSCNNRNTNKGGSISAKVEDWVKSNTKKGTWKQMYVMLVFFLCGVCFAPHEHHPELGVFVVSAGGEEKAKYKKEPTSLAHR